ncbi:hypothetical protein ACIBJF_51160 [Streptomyces sp. NPDC050743]|uniref:hypothetical protein n=1 Tax=Streptomyces sp. NPDC050743 TaxID=3365634 RepID=UPI0037B804F1
MTAALNAVARTNATGLFPHPATIHTVSATLLTVARLRHYGRRTVARVVFKPIERNTDEG